MSCCQSDFTAPENEQQNSKEKPDSAATNPRRLHSDVFETIVITRFLFPREGTSFRLAARDEHQVGVWRLQYF